MSLGLAPVLRQRFFDHSSGAPLAGGKLFSYLAGTTTPTATYQDSAGLTANSNPIILDSNGECEVFITVGSNAYKFVLEDANGVVQWTTDNVTVSGVSGPSGWTKYTITDGQSAAILTGMSIDNTVYTSATFDVEIIRGTATFSNMPGGLAIQNVNGTGRVVTGLALANEAHGCTFTVSQVGSVISLEVACSTGPGSGTIKLRQTSISI